MYNQNRKHVTMDYSILLNPPVVVEHAISVVPVPVKPWPQRFPILQDREYQHQLFVEPDCSPRYHGRYSVVADCLKAHERTAFRVTPSDCIDVGGLFSDLMADSPYEMCLPSSKSGFGIGPFIDRP
ncbi:uncharacterized protein LOC134207850 [Armigeres subalbatus]|uniref:uncharacterized protein LOC134207850 n=1 Tax=Armigeres subalbatus TaxID=124917 RepID=UPI002ED27CEE